MSGTKQSFAPLHGARSGGGGLRLAVTKDLATGAPGAEAGGHIEDPENAAPRTRYGGYLGGAGQDQGHGYAGDARDDLAGRDGVQGRDARGPAADGAMTRSEERLHVGTGQAEAGRARLRKYVVTQNVTAAVPVSHQEVRAEREPITGADRDAALSGDPISEEEHEVTLHAERPVVNKDTVPVERVRLGTGTVTEDLAWPAPACPGLLTGARHRQDTDRPAPQGHQGQAAPRRAQGSQERRPRPRQGPGGKRQAPPPRRPRRRKHSFLRRHRRRLEAAAPGTNAI
jgi:uncharacterized protein (TIGR02271 family)